MTPPPCPGRRPFPSRDAALLSRGSDPHLMEGLVRRYPFAYATQAINGSDTGEVVHPIPGMT
ncbi:MAG TPA: hypothetical protein VGC15_16320 [Acetobacteraceae bacterium]